MHEVIIEHVKVEELPASWRARLAASGDVRVTVRIEREAAAPQPASGIASDDPAFGIWRDRRDMDDVPAYLKALRSPRFTRAVPDTQEDHGT